MSPLDEELPTSADGLRVAIATAALGPDDLPTAEATKSAQTLRDVKPLVDVLKLDDRGWLALHRRFASHRPTSNLKPWLRILGILRSHRARTAIVEAHYVCLDFRSEHVAFYAHLDRRIPASTERIHFFEGDVEISDLREAEASASYLGYVVCRPAGLPLVGRSVIRPPAGCHTVTSVTEPVHLLGRTLTAHGVPFMQQDSRMAVCANVAMWTLHHTAYRRHLVERHFIADFLPTREGPSVLSLGEPRGLSADQAQAILDREGMRARVYDLYANPLPPSIPWHQVWSSSQDDLSEAVRQLGELASANASVMEASSLTKQDLAKVSADLTRYHDMMLTVLTPYLESGFPAILGTSDHAFTLCGLASNGTANDAIIHDDQFGPYLRAPNLCVLTREMLARQVPDRPEDSSDEEWASIETFEKWWVDANTPRPLIEYCTDANLTHDRAVVDVVAATPPRALLDPARVHYRGALHLKTALSILSELGVGLPEGEQDLIASFATRCNLIKGVSYKGQALNRAAGETGEAMATVQLAEWVVVIELMTQAGNVIGEVVFDASSNDRNPRVQLLRLGDSVAVRTPEDDFETFAQLPVNWELECGPISVRESIHHGVAK